MTDLEERKAKAVAEYNEILEWSIRESDKVFEKLQAEGKPLGLDTNKEAYAYIKEVRKQRLKEIFEKYDLPPDTKLKLR